MIGALPVIGALILAGLAVHEVVFTARHLAKCPPDRCTCPLSHRFLAGRPFHGHVVTDATFLRPAANVLTRAKHASPFQKLPGWKRRAWRTGPVAVAAAAMIDPALAGVAAVAAAACLAGARAAMRTGLHRRLLLRLRHRDRVQTMGMLLATITGTAASTAEAGVTWNPGYATAEPGDEVARWVLPRGFKATGKEKAQAEEVWQSRIGFEVVFAGNSTSMSLSS